MREAEREEMVRTQLIPRGISGRGVLEAFRKVPRHEFISGGFAKEAYADHPLPTGEGQTISQPYMVALMTERLQLSGGQKVLEVGTGSGYQTAILAELSKEVYSIEKYPSLADAALERLNGMGYKNIHIKAGDGSVGWREFAPYDRILVTAAAPDAPGSLLAQLAENGRLVIPIGGVYSQVLTIFEKKNGKVIATEDCGCVFVPLIGKEGWKTENEHE